MHSWLCCGASPEMPFLKIKLSRRSRDRDMLRPKTCARPDVMLACRDALSPSRWGALAVCAEARVC